MRRTGFGLEVIESMAQTVEVANAMAGGPVHYRRLAPQSDERRKFARRAKGRILSLAHWLLIGRSRNRATRAQWVAVSWQARRK